MRVRIWSQSHGFQTMLLHDVSVNPGLVGELSSFSQVGLLFLEINLTKVGLGPALRSCTFLKYKEDYF